MKQIKRENLYFKDARSDKAYQVTMYQTEEGCLVEIAYGRRGAALKASMKTPTALPIEKAEAVFNKAVQAKTKKGYTPEEGGAAFTGTEDAGRATGFAPQLLNPIPLDDITALLASDPKGWFIQVKSDGVRCGVKVENGEVIASNRRGLRIGFPESIAETLLSVCDGVEYEFDGELMGDHYVIFDCLSVDKRDLRQQPFSRRAFHLDEWNALHVEEGGNVLVDVPVLASQYWETYHNHIEASGGEGYVLKRADSLYEAGRPDKLGDQLKFKFVADCSITVAAISDGKRSVKMEMLNAQGERVDVGNVTIPPNAEMPAVGTVLDVQYLYAYPDGGKLFQPVYKGIRDDLVAGDCEYERLKFKPDAPTVDAPGDVADIKAVVGL